MSSHRDDLLWHLLNLDLDVLMELLVDLDAGLAQYDFTRELIFRLLDNQKSDMSEADGDIIYRVVKQNGEWLKTNGTGYRRTEKVYSQRGAKQVASMKGGRAQRGYVQWEDL